MSDEVEIPICSGHPGGRSRQYLTQGSVTDNPLCTRHLGTRPSSSREPLRASLEALLSSQAWTSAQTSEIKAKSRGLSWDDVNVASGDMGMFDTVRAEIERKYVDNEDTWDLESHWAAVVASCPTLVQMWCGR